MYLSKDEERRLQSYFRDRRRFLRIGSGMAAALLLVPGLGAAKAGPERRLRFHNTHTGENTSAVYWADGDYLADGRQEIDRILRDHRTGEVHPIVPELLDTLFVLQTRVQSQQAYEIISGYRSPATNAALRKQSTGVAKRSYHMQGRAIDVRLRGCELKNLHKAALGLKAGGVGYYPGSDFIHVDNGPYRSW